MIRKFFLYSLVMLTPTLLFAGQHPMRTSADTNTAIVYAPRYLPPADEKPMMIELGAGFGLPYGFIGGKFSLGSSVVTGDVGVGLIPFAWDVSGSIGGSIHFLDRYSTVRPKITVLWTNTAGYNLILGQSDFSGTALDSKVLYNEAFPGFAVFSGCDIRLGETRDLTIDLNVGLVFPGVGVDEMEKRYNDYKQALQNQGWSFTSETASFAIGPKFSIGLNYVIGRSLELR